MLPTITQLREAARRDRKNATAANLLGEALYRRLEYASAEKCFRRAASLQPNNVKYLANLAGVLQQLGKIHSAEAAFRQAIQLEPNSYNFHAGLAQLYLDEMNDAVKATEYYHKAVFLSPEESNSQIHAYSGLCSCYLQNDTFKQGLIQVERKVGTNKNMVNILQGFAFALYGRGRYDEMRDCVQRLLQLKPSDAMGLSLLARAAKDQQDLKGAAFYHQQALRLYPSHISTILSYLRFLQLLGKFDAARRYYRELATRASFLKYDKPEWDGSSLAGKTIMLISRFGYGDAIQGAVFAAVLEQQGAAVLFQTHQPVCSLIGTADGVKRAIALHDECPLYDFVCNTMSIWYLLDVDFESLGRHAPYLHPPARLRKKWKARINASGLKVGLCWRSSASLLHSNSYTNRSMLFEELLPLAEVSGVTYISLQKGAETSRSNGDRLAFPLLDHTSEIRDFLDTAAIIADLDLVVTVDTSIAHLAGALGKPTFLLIPYSADWKWLLDRVDSPWYQTMRVFRQPTPGGWCGIIPKVRQAIEAFAETRANA